MASGLWRQAFPCLARSNDGNTLVTANNRSFVNDDAGRVLYRVQHSGAVERQLIANGEVLGRFGGALADFNFGYTPISASFPKANPGTYAVGASDSLRSIARAVYGDSSLWYLIADANGVASDKELRVGQTLNLPNRVTGAANNASTFRPYDPSQIVGDTTPTLPNPPPPKQKKGCGGLGKLIMIVVAVVVTIYTAGAMSATLTTGFSQTMAVGASALSGGGAVAGVAGSVAAAGFGTAAVAGAVGSIVSQVAGNMLGVQDGFSWKSVALSALSAGVSSGVASTLGQPGGALSGNTWQMAASRAAVSNALTQGIGVITGLQESFDWRSVAASAVGAGVGHGVGDALGMNTKAFQQANFGDQLGKRFISGMAAGTATAVMRGGRVAVQQIATDAFGNALGSSLAAGSTSASSASVPVEYEDNDAGYRLPGQYVTRDNPDVATLQHVDNDAGYRLPGQYVTSDSAASGPSTVRAGDYGGSMERVARANLGPNASQREINNYVGQLLEINQIGNPRAVQGDRSILLPDANTPAATSGLKVYGEDIALGENMKAQAQAQLAAQAAQTATTMGQDEAYALRMSGGPRGGTGVAYGDAPMAGVTNQGFGDAMNLLGPEFGGYSGLGTVTSSLGEFNHNLGMQKQAILDGIVDRRGGALAYVAAELFVPGSGLEAAAVAAGPVIGKMVGSGVAALNKLPVLGADLGVAANGLAVSAAALGSRLLDNAAGPRLNPQFGGVLVDSGVASSTGGAKGLRPINSPVPEKWVGKGGSVWNELDGTWVYQDRAGNVVRYPGGYPDFQGGGHVRQSVNIQTVPNHSTDFINANRLAPLGAKLPENSWHHHQNGTTMQEINRIIHQRFTHRGGVSIKNGGQ